MFYKKTNKQTDRQEKYTYRLSFKELSIKTTQSNTLIIGNPGKVQLTDYFKISARIIRNPG